MTQIRKNVTQNITKNNLTQKPQRAGKQSTSKIGLFTHSWS
jgi:hypothetical protein